ncbi:MAG: N-acetylmuramoyl-L-alanine amidase [Synergistaceae bacterium]|nr:N-acetylmuramoyl-L-alanine amidase [Synergistaceae bacterium]
MYTRLSPNHSGKRKHAVDRITPHCVVGQLTVEQLGNIFSRPERKASSNYGIGTDGGVGLYVEEENRSWCSSSAENDNRAITIECASDTKEPYAFKDCVYEKLIELCTDICLRYGKSKLLWLESKSKTLGYEPKSDEMILTVHRWFANKACPGEWLYSRMGDLAEKVTARLNGFYRVRKSWEDANSQLGAFRSLENARKTAAEHEGYYVFNEKGEKV